VTVPSSASATITGAREALLIPAVSGGGRALEAIGRGVICA